MLLNPQPNQVLAPRGCKNVYNIVNNNEKENITTLVTVNAAGCLAPSLVVFKGASLPDNAAAFAPLNFSFGFTENGWMVAKLFFEYIANIFEPWLTEHNILRPVILYVDGHVSHLTLHLSKFCSEKQIIIIALPPNATHIMQPLDVGFFRPLKIQWQKEYKEFCKDFISVGIHKYQFAPLLDKTFKSMDMKKILSNSFKKCGLFPFNSSAIDSTKLLVKNKAGNESIDTETISEKISDENDFEKFLSEEQLASFKANDGPEWNGIERDFSLYTIWYNSRRSANDRSYVNNSQVI